MAMGSTGTVNITPKMMKDALSAITEYRETASSLEKQLTETVTSLVASDFTGSAAEGFKYFYDNKITPIIGEDLKTLIDALEDIAQGTLDAIPADEQGLDDKLGAGNKQEN